MFTLKRFGLGREATSSPGTLMFIHIPKTAGTTFQTILERIYGPDLHCAIYPNWEATRPVALGHAWGAALRVVGGHFPYGLHADPELRPLLMENADYVTFLRDPVARVVSHFNHVMNGEYPEHREILAKYPTIEKFVEHPWARNVQTSFLLGFDLEFDDDPRAAIRAAKAILRDRIKVVGLAERFDETLILCAEAFGWDLPAYTSENRAVDRARKLGVKDLDKSVIARIRAANQCDLAIYEYAQTLFAKRRARTPHFAAKLNRHRARLQSATITAVSA